MSNVIKLPHSDSTEYVISTTYNTGNSPKYDRMVSVLGFRSAMTVYRRRIQLACLQMLVDLAFIENRDFREYVADLPKPEDTEFYDFEKCDDLSIEYSPNTTVIRNRIGYEYYITIFEVGGVEQYGQGKSQEEQRTSFL